MNHLEERLSRDRLQKQEQEARQQRLEASKYHVEIEYDPDRLYEPTQAWTARGKTPRGESKGTATPSSILHVPHRATPSWRQ